MLASSSLPLVPEAYAPFCGERFSLRPAGSSMVEFTLTEVKKYLDDEIQLSFSLFFRAPPPLVTQGIHRLGHPQLGEIDLSLVPIRRLRDAFVYEAVFNLLREPEQN